MTDSVGRPEAAPESAWETHGHVELTAGRSSEMRVNVCEQIDEKTAHDTCSLGPAPTALCYECRDGFINSLAPVRTELPEHFEQMQPLVEGDGEGVEIPHNLEVLVQGAMPVALMIALADSVEERHPRLASPAQDLHLCFVVRTIGMRTIDHVENAGPFQNGQKELPLVEELV